MALNNVPIAGIGQTLAVTATPINQNFSAIDVAFQVDHVDYNAPGQGKHEKVSIPASSIAPTFSAGDEGLYNLPYANGTNTLNETFIHKQVLAGTQDTPFTASVLSSTAPVNNLVGWSYLPSGILLRWDQFAVGSGLTTVTFGAGWPGFTNLFWVGVTSVGTPGPVVSLGTIISNTQFTVYSSAAGSCNIIAIGM